MGFDIIGYTSLFLVTLIYLVFSLYKPSIANFLFVALGIRIFTIFFNNNIMALPDSYGDADFFLARAYEYSGEGFLNLFNLYPGLNSFFISWLIAFLFSIFGQSELMAQSLSLFFGVGTVYLGFKVSKKIWNKKIANRVGWVLAVFPTLVLYSSLVLREPYICFILLLTLNSCVDWIRTKSYKSLIVVIACFVIGAHFHGAIIIGLLVFITYFLLENLQNIFKKLTYLKINIKHVLSVILIIIVCISYVSKGVQIPKIGSITNIFQKENSIFDRIIDKNRAFNKGDAKYPEWLLANSKIEFIYKAPFRIVYFLYSPFPWDLKKISHIIGLFDGLLYIYLTYLIFCNRKQIFSNPILKLILLILLAYVVVYGVSIGNFGTGIRHRSKFVIMFILLAAPFLPRIKFSKKSET